MSQVRTNLKEYILLMFLGTFVYGPWLCVLMEDELCVLGALGPVLQLPALMLVAAVEMLRTLALLLL